MKTPLTSTLAALALLGTTSVLAEPPTVLFVLDGSGSMWGQIDGRPKIEIARTVMGELMTNLPEQTRTGLMSFGHNRRNDCEDIELLAPVGSNPPALVAALNRVTPMGRTPLTEAIRQATLNLRDREGNVSVVMVSDGEETCGGDPCQAARIARESGVGLRIHVIGFDVTPQETEQLTCVAEAGGGRYFQAASAQELTLALAEVRREVAAPPSPPPPPEPVVQTTEMPISAKRASSDQAAPVALEIGEVVRGRLGATGTHHYWRLEAPPDRYRVVLDVKRADDRHRNIQTEVVAFRPDGSQAARVIRTNEIDFRTRAIAVVDASSDPDLTLRIGNRNDIVDYWIGVFPLDAEIVSPYFVRTPTVQPLEFGKPYTAVLEHKPGEPGEAWYAADLEGIDYRVSVEFARTDGRRSNVQGQVVVFGRNGERLSNLGRICSVNQINITATCVTKLILAEDAELMFRVMPGNEARYRTVFSVEPHP